VTAAVIMRLPSLIHEQNYYPGLTNRILAPWVRRVAVSFEETKHYFGGRGEVTGNPIRAAFRSAKRKTRGDTFNILIFGGSQGAKAINNSILDALPHLQEHRRESGADAPGPARGPGARDRHGALRVLSGASGRRGAHRGHDRGDRRVRRAW